MTPQTPATGSGAPPEAAAGPRGRVVLLGITIEAFDWWERLALRLAEAGAVTAFWPVGATGGGSAGFSGEGSRRLFELQVAVTRAGGMAIAGEPALLGAAAAAPDWIIGQFARADAAVIRSADLLAPLQGLARQLHKPLPPLQVYLADADGAAPDTQSIAREAWPERFGLEPDPRARMTVTRLPADAERALPWLERALCG